MVIEIGNNMTLVLLAAMFSVVYITKKFMDDQENNNEQRTKNTRVKQ